MVIPVEGLLVAEQFPGSDELTKAISTQCQQHLALLFNEAVRPRESFLMNRTIQGDSTILVPELFWVLVVLKGPFRLLQGFPELGSPEAIRCISQWKAHSFTTALANVVSSLGKNASLTHHAGCRKKKISLSSACSHYLPPLQILTSLQIHSNGVT